MLSNAQSNFKKVTIIGNANGDWQAATQGFTIIFNGTFATGDKIINICNGPYAGSKEDFVVTGLHQAWLANQLSLIANELEEQLSCWPSSGLVSFVLFSRIGSELSLSRMSLLPSLNRGLDLLDSEHLPCVVHNWLGERRIALKLHSNDNNGNGIQAHWPELHLLSTNAKSTSNNNDMDIASQDPFEQFMLLSQQPVKSISGMSVLTQLSQLPLSIWLKHSSQQKLLQVEQILFNEHPETNTGFWYLSDNEASAFLDSIRTNLALCQQQLMK